MSVTVTVQAVLPRTLAAVRRKIAPGEVGSASKSPAPSKQRARCTRAKRREAKLPWQSTTGRTIA
ncbi:hypothetical protein J2S92_001007 [Arthrobacter bambusae]|nr:hypothetical protein [Arthrobacter bambusae]MDQ0234784.1 hypothetical protein [Arthrobacter bambusae]